MSNNSDTPYQTKGYIVRGYYTELQRRGLTSAIAARLSPAARELVLSPTSSSAWIDGAHFIELVVAIESEIGTDMLREVSHLAITHGATSALAPLVEGFLRLFGVTPHTLFARLGSISTVSNRGVDFHYAKTGERSGGLTMSFPYHRDVPIALFHAMSGTMVAIFDACGARAQITSPEYTPDLRRNGARYKMTW